MYYEEDGLSIRKDTWLETAQLGKDSAVKLLELLAEDFSFVHNDCYQRYNSTTFMYNPNWNKE